MIFTFLTRDSHMMFTAKTDLNTRRCKALRHMPGKEKKSRAMLDGDFCHLWFDYVKYESSDHRLWQYVWFVCIALRGCMSNVVFYFCLFSSGCRERSLVQLIFNLLRHNYTRNSHGRVVFLARMLFGLDFPVHLITPTVYCGYVGYLKWHSSNQSSSKTCERQI